MDPLMPTQPMGQPTDPLDARLRSLADAGPWPTTPDVVGGALGRIRGEGHSRPRAGMAAHHRLVLIVVLLALLLAAAVASAALLGLPGLRFGVTDALPSPAIPSEAAAVRASLGDPADLAAARTALGDDLLVPISLGDPAEVYVGAVGSRPRVALVYPPADGAPALVGDIGLIVTEWGGALDEPYARKWLQEDQGHAEAITIDGQRGYWVSGMPHVLEYLDDQSGVRRSATRLVGDVLVWQSGPVVYRIESPLGLEATVAIADSMR
jgi:hypothetical protein